MVQLESRILLDFLGEIDKELDGSVTLVAVGGTALTLLGVKSSTVDVDFAFPADGDYVRFEGALKIVPHGFQVHCFHNGLIFSQGLPADYLQRSEPVKTKMKYINLRTLSPLDIVVTKIGRLDQRDKEDILSCINRFGLTKEAVEERARQVDYVGRQENYDMNLKYVLENFFKK